ncbi:hypothetical protein POF50_008175 [Streptomyces sp. SL13]|uniref:Uncharacterized protein n=1 Tax=Streptantibioticus silvisoli TaxID=2705255 RepID=A0AA90GZE5_9ACTN|nr:hypothetical protein [Streptantibioticus silvisoli]MDI5963452.1 hypothetical protein [Streptantibioticus silvisoli]MDI5969321.1 hypothetical protein [Streptantibioticus silvisoli]
MRRSRRAAAAAIALGLAAGVTVLAAPAASAATAVSCSSAQEAAVGSADNRSTAMTTSTTACPGWVDNGGPYTFSISQVTIVVTILRPGQPPQYLPLTLDNEVATCQTVAVSGTKINAGGCTYSP